MHPSRGVGGAGLIGHCQQVFGLAEVAAHYDNHRHARQLQRSFISSRFPDFLANFPTLAPKKAFPHRFLSLFYLSTYLPIYLSPTRPHLPLHHFTRSTRSKESSRKTRTRHSRRRIPLPRAPHLACGIRFLIGCRTIAPSSF